MLRKTLKIARVDPIGCEEGINNHMKLGPAVYPNLSFITQEDIKLYFWTLMVTYLMKNVGLSIYLVCTCHVLGLESLQDPSVDPAVEYPRKLTSLHVTKVRQQERPICAPRSLQQSRTWGPEVCRKHSRYGVLTSTSVTSCGETRKGWQRGIYVLPDVGLLGTFILRI